VNVIEPATLAELQDAVLSAPRVIAVGAGTKPRLSAVEGVRISTRLLRGIVEYDPAEFTFTALAGTPLSEMVVVLAERGQHLPFDPMLVEAGSTLGGAVASGLSGPGRFRSGGVRDFLIGVQCVDGLGRLLRLGGKVVKNAAGFDLPKFLVGSLGRFAVIGAVTFKVFPRPAATRTVSLPATPGLLARLAAGRWNIDALDLPPGGRRLLVRLAGPEESLGPLEADILRTLPKGENAETVAAGIWNDLREFRWGVPNGVLVKSAITLGQVGDFAASHVSGGGNVAYSSVATVAELPTHLVGMTLSGAAPLWVGQRPRYAIESAVKQALDPDHRFPSLDD